MSRAAWGGLNVTPGDLVRHNTHGVGVVGGDLYEGARSRQVRLIRRGILRGSIELAPGSLEIIAPAPVYEVGQTTPMGEVLERWEREDAPGYMYRIKIGEMADGEDRSTEVGPERFQTNSED